jgi:hypothetical protein
VKWISLVGLLDWRNPFIQIFVLLVMSTIGGICIVLGMVPLWLRICIYFCWAITGLLSTICVIVVIDEEKARSRRRRQGVLDQQNLTAKQAERNGDAASTDKTE